MDRLVVRDIDRPQWGRKAGSGRVDDLPVPGHAVASSTEQEGQDRPQVLLGWHAVSREERRSEGVFYATHLKMEQVSGERIRSNVLDMAISTSRNRWPHAH